MEYLNSPVQKVFFNNHKIYVKRDDLLSEEFSGNKARKFFYFLKNDFPNINKVLSYGSSQSNAMYSLSVLCKEKNWDFEYYVDHISSYLKENPIGNYKKALENKMKIFEEALPKKFDENTLFIKEGGALNQAQYGIELLASEIVSWAKENNKQNIKIFLPSGTGTTALYLQKYLPFEVLTCPCVGDEEYLKKQFFDLEQEKHPNILKLNKKYHFGKLYKEFYEIHKDLLKQTNIEFDLLYDSLGWICLSNYLEENPNLEVLYIHQGGLIGNESMKQRYEYKYAK